MFSCKDVQTGMNLFFNLQPQRHSSKAATQIARPQIHFFRMLQIQHDLNSTNYALRVVLTIFSAALVVAVMNNALTVNGEHYSLSWDIHLRSTHTVNERTLNCCNVYNRVGFIRQA